MSVFLISIEDNKEGVVIKANDIRHPKDESVLAYDIGCFLIDALNQHLIANGEKPAVYKPNKTTH